VWRRVLDSVVLADDRAELLCGRNSSALRVAAMNGSIQSARALLADGRADGAVQGVLGALAAYSDYGRVAVTQHMWVLFQGAVRWQRRRQWLLRAAAVVVTRRGCGSVQPKRC
jgi:hypothetical protein